MEGKRLLSFPTNSFPSGEKQRAEGTYFSSLAFRTFPIPLEEEGGESVGVLYFYEILLSGIWVQIRRRKEEIS